MRSYLTNFNKAIVSCLILIIGTVGCADGGSGTDGHELLASDYRIFQQTIAWDLAKAVHNEDTDLIKQLVNKNKGLTKVVDPRYGQTLLGLAVYNEKYNSCQALLESGADPNAFNNYNGETPLMEAAQVDDYFKGADPRYLELLLKYGGNPNLEEKDLGLSGSKGQTPLSLACSIRNGFEYVKILIKAGAKLDYRPETVPSLLDSATLSENPDVVLYLIENGIDYTQPTVIYYNPNKKMYITNNLRYWRFDLGSEKYKKKMKIVDFLKMHGMDYRKTKIPPNYYGQYDQNYLDKY